MTPSTQWTETVAPDEEQRFPKLAEKLAATQRARGDTGSRVLHAKSHAGVRARLRVLDDLPTHARQGLFAAAREHRAYVRFSNGAGARQPDRAPDLRGFAVKILDVPGAKVLGEATTQDLLMIDSPTVPFRTPEEFVTFVCATAEAKGAVGRVFRELGLFRAIGLLAALAGTAKGKPRSVADKTYFTAAAIAFGPFAARLSAVPLVPSPGGAAGTTPGYLADELRARLRSAPLEYELRAQFFTGEGTPIEDSTRPWDSPSLPVARLTIDPTDVTAPPGRRLHDFVERLSFDPWHALVEHRPLGQVMRARKHAYYASTQQRGAAAEPDGSEWTTFDA